MVHIPAVWTKYTATARGRVLKLVPCERCTTEYVDVVPEARWRASRAHAISVWGTHPPGVLDGGLLLNYARRRRT